VSSGSFPQDWRGSPSCQRHLFQARHDSRPEQDDWCEYEGVKKDGASVYTLQELPLPSYKFFHRGAGHKDGATRGVRTGQRGAPELTNFWCAIKSADKVGCDLVFGSIRGGT